MRVSNSLSWWQFHLISCKDSQLSKGVFIIYPLGGGLAKSWGGGRKVSGASLEGGRSLEFQDS